MAPECEHCRAVVAHTDSHLLCLLHHLLQDTPGFIVNRLLVPYLLEAVRLYERGIALSPAGSGLSRGQRKPAMSQDGPSLPHHAENTSL